MNKYLEDKVLISIVNYLKFYGFLHTSTGAGLIKNQKTQILMNRLGYKSGSPDLIVFIKNGVVCIECKKPATYRWSERYKRMVIDERAGTQSNERKEFQAIIENLPGHHYIVAKSVSDVVDYFHKNNIQPK